MRLIRLIVNWAFYIAMLPFVAIILIIMGLLAVSEWIYKTIKNFKYEFSYEEKVKYLGDKFFWED